MAKIKYAVVGIDPQSLNNLIGTLARGEVDGEAETVVLPAPVPVVYQYTAMDFGRVQIKEVSLTHWLATAVAREIKRLEENSPINSVAEMMAGYQEKG